MRLSRQSRVKVGLIVALAVVVCLVFGSCSTGVWNPAQPLIMIEAPAAPAAPSAPDAPQAPKATAFQGSAELLRKEFDPSQVRSVDLAWAAGSVTMRVADDQETQGKVLVVERGSGSAKATKPANVSCDDGVLSIDYGQNRWSGFAACSFHGSKSIEVTFPASVARGLEHIEVNGASGSYDLEGLGCEHLEVELASGSLSATGMSAEEVELDVASGQVQLEGAFPDVIGADVSSGEVRVTSTAERFPERIDIDVLSGNLVLVMPEAGGFTASVGRLSGNFSCGFETSLVDGAYVHGDGASSVNVSMTSGNVTLNPA